MAQIIFGPNTAPTEPNLDLNFTELYNGILIASGNPIGYAAGSGGAVTQLTSKSTDVTLNKVCGQITMHAASLAAGASVNFTLLNSLVATYDVLAASLYVTGTTNGYTITSQCRGSGAGGGFSIRITNVTGGALAEAVMINFAIIKGAGT